ncbi:MAG: aldehyde dehydrogenase family protein, partial [Bacillota bacterium]|nr:aldehyde dehydrogenase family protein [Bacillota bacterium]
MAVSGGVPERDGPVRAATRAVPEYGFFIGGEWQEAAETMPVTHKYTGETLARVGVASREDVRRAVDAAERAFREQRPSPRERAAWLLRTAELI